MTQLSFSLEDGKYVAYTTVNADFATHIEREKNGSLEFASTTIQNAEYVPFLNLEYTPLSPHYDKDFDDIVYPKYLRITSGTPVTLGYVKEND